MNNLQYVNELNQGNEQSVKKIIYVHSTSWINPKNIITILIFKTSVWWKPPQKQS